MKFLVVLACALAVASAGYVAPVTFYAGGQHLPVIGANGVPVDTAEVQHARAAHYAHKVEAHVRNGDYAVAPVVAAHTAYAAPWAHSAYAAHAYPHAYPVVAQGVPADTPEVVAAKINHFAAHAEAAARTAHPVLFRKRRGVYAAAPVAYSSAYTTPVLASTYAHHTPVVASTYAHHSPVVASTYAHHTPVVSAYSAFPYSHYY